MLTRIIRPAALFGKLLRNSSALMSGRKSIVRARFLSSHAGRLKLLQPNFVEDFSETSLGSSSLSTDSMHNSKEDFLSSPEIIDKAESVVPAGVVENGLLVNRAPTIEKIHKESFKTIVFLYPNGSGKSSLLAAFSQQENPFILLRLGDGIDEAKINVCKQHDYLLKSSKVPVKRKKLYRKISEGEASREELENFFLKYFIEDVSAHHGEKPWLLVDDYDAPAYDQRLNKYCEKATDSLHKLIAPALKSGAFKKAVIMGVFNIAKDGLFSAVNDVVVYPSWSKKYALDFVLTESSIKEIWKKAHYSQLQHHLVGFWYGHYKANCTEKVYNPLLITACIKHEGEIGQYREKRGKQLLEDAILKGPYGIMKDFILLLQGKLIEKFISEDDSFQGSEQNPSLVWTRLVHMGHLTVKSYRQTEQGTFAKLIIPNNEIRSLYRNVIEQWLANEQGPQWYNDFINELVSGNISNCKKYLDQIILQVAKFRDEPQAFYEGLLLGLTASLLSGKQYEIDSHCDNSQRFCIRIISKCDRPHLVLELKLADEREELILASHDALRHIKENSLSEIDLHETVKIGIGFHGKYLEISYQTKAAEYQAARRLA